MCMAHLMLCAVPTVGGLPPHHTTPHHTTMQVGCACAHSAPLPLFVCQVLTTVDATVVKVSSVVSTVEGVVQSDIGKAVVSNTVDAVKAVSGVDGQCALVRVCARVCV